MAPIIKKIDKFIRGESETEYLQRKAAVARIRKESRAAAFQAQREEAVALAKTKQRLIREAQEKKLKARLNPPKRPMNYPSFRDTPFGTFNGFQRPQKVMRTRPPKRFDVLGL